MMNTNVTILTVIAIIFAMLIDAQSTILLERF